jgi:zinc protease
MMLTRIQQREDDTGAVASRLAKEMLFPKANPYHSDPLGYEETVTAIDRPDLLSFWQKQYGPESAILSFSGRIDMDDFVETVNALSAGWEPEGGRPRIPPVKTSDPPKPARKTRAMMHKSQVDIAVACQVVQRSHPDHYALSLANAILGLLGLMGRLGKTIRDKQGLAYYATSYYYPRLTGGYWMAYVGTNPANVDRALSSTYDEMIRISEKPVSRREYADVRTNRIGTLALRLETCVAAAGFMHELEIHGLGLDYVDRYEAIVNSVTREDISRVCREYFIPERCATAIVGPYEEQDPGQTPFPGPAKG